MDLNLEDREYQNLEPVFQHEAAQYIVTYPHGRSTKKVDCGKHEEVNKKRFPVGRSGNNPGRVKRVVSSKRKTHHLTVARRKQLGPVRTFDAANKENKLNCIQDMQQEIFDMDPCEFAPNVNNNDTTGRTGSEQADYCTLAELTRDHNKMTDVLFGRHLRLKVSLTLWQRNVGELLTYFLTIQDIAVFVDFLPLMSKCIDRDSNKITIGSCVDLFPLVTKVLKNPYEEYVTVGLKWINSVLKNWRDELRSSGYSGSTKPSSDKSYQVFNQLLLELWHQEPLLKSVTGSAGDIAKTIDSFLSQIC